MVRVSSSAAVQRLGRRRGHRAGRARRQGRVARPVCELLGIVSSVPTDIVFSFSGFALRGGQTGPHADGWGLALYERHVRAHVPRADARLPSPLARFIRENPIKTLLAIAHVRTRRAAAPPLENTHPFVRVLWGRHFVFAHNGTLPQVKRLPLRARAPARRHRQRARLLLDARAAARAFPGGYPRTPRRSRAPSSPSPTISAATGSSTSCSPTGAICSRAAATSSATSSAGAVGHAPRCATRSWRSTSRRCCTRPARSRSSPPSR